MDASKNKSTAARKPATHPAYKDMIVEALRTLKERSGSSRQKILNFIQQNYKTAGDEAMVNRHVKAALKRSVQSGAIIQSKGVGASGSFKLPAAVKKPAPAAKKPVAVKKATKPVAAAKKPTAKKAAAKKRPAASAKKATPKKPKTKEAKKPTVKKSPARKPKKAVKPKAKSSATKKSAAKTKSRK